MTDNNHEPAESPKVHFELPVDQLGAEMALVEKYTGGPMEPVVAEYLDNLKRFAGIGMPKYGDFSILSKNVSEEGVPEEMKEDIGGGMVSFGSTNSPGAFVKMPLTPPAVRISQEAFDDLSQPQRDHYTITQYGEAVVGDSLPADTREMLEDIYSLIGAQLVRDDEATDFEDGETLYRGTYMGTVVYLGERRTSISSVHHEAPYTVRTVTMYGERLGKTVEDELSVSDFERMRQLGINTFKARSDGVDRKSLESYIATALEINGIGQEAGPASEPGARGSEKERKLGRFLRRKS